MEKQMVIEQLEKNIEAENKMFARIEERYAAGSQIYRAYKAKHDAAVNAYENAIELVRGM